jgi:hypothetical protein
MHKLLILICVLCAAGCKDPYDLPLRPSDKSLLVVEGVLRVGQDSTFITLSKTVNVNEKISFKPVTKARLSVEDKTGRSIFLNESGNGKYAINNLGLVVGSEYLLRIKTADNKEYVSEYVIAQVTPAIDSINWKKDNEGLGIFVNTHDNSNNTRYYRWDFDETWEILSFYPSNYQYLGGSTVIYSPRYHYQCWKYSTSTTINIASSAQLSSDVISQFGLLHIKQGSEKISVRYSIQVKQEALTKKAYEYLMLMKKNTETLGSIFDPLPSNLTGNIKCISNPEEGVIGYLTASSLRQQRIYITAQEAEWRYYQNCFDIVYIPDHPDSIKALMPIFSPFNYEFIIEKGKLCYVAANPECVECTKRGGALARPSYW